MKKYAFLILLFLLQISFADGQIDTTEVDKKTEKKAARAEKKADKVAKGEFLITPFGAPG